MEPWLLFLLLSAAVMGSAVAGGSLCAIALAKLRGFSRESASIPATVAAQCSASIAAIATLRALDPALLKPFTTLALSPLLAPLAAASIALALALTKLCRAPALAKEILSCAQSASIKLCISLPMLVPPATEEILFRGVMQWLLTQALNPWIALAITATVFTLGHARALGSKALPIVFAQSIVFGLPIALWSSLPPCIALHYAANIAGSARTLAALAKRSDREIVEELRRELSEIQASHAN